MKDSGHRSQNLPGALWLLISEGRVRPAHPDVSAVLMGLGSDWDSFDVVEGRLEQRGWHLRRDAALALVVAHDLVTDPRLSRLLQIGLQWLRRSSVSVDALQKAAGEACGFQFAAETKLDKNTDRVEVERMFGESSTVVRAFDDVLENPPCPKQAELTSCAMQAAKRAAEGWLSFHALRNLPSDVADLAARSIRLAGLNGEPLAIKVAQAFSLS